MKYLLILLLIITTPILGQGYVLLGAFNKGIQSGVGVLSNNIDISLKYQMPIISLEIPRILSFTVGNRILLSNYDTDNFSVTPSIGYAYLRRRDFSQYNTLDKILLIEEFKPIYGVELGKDWYMGRLFISANYCDRAYFGIGIKAFIK